MSDAYTSGKIANMVKSSFLARGMTFNVGNLDLWQAKEGKLRFG